MLAHQNVTQNALLFTAAYLPWQSDAPFRGNTSVGYVLFFNATVDRWPHVGNNNALELQRAARPSLPVARRSVGGDAPDA